MSYTVVSAPTLERVPTLERAPTPYVWPNFLYKVKFTQMSAHPGMNFLHG